MSSAPRPGRQANTYNPRKPGPPKATPTVPKNVPHVDREVYTDPERGAPKK
jgi:hypothetical protein